MRASRNTRKPTVRKPSLSPSRISIYLECAVKYRYIYVDKIGRYYLRGRAGYSFGSTLHQVLQQFHKTGAELSSRELTDMVDVHWIPAGYTSAQEEQEHLDQGRQIVSAYHEAFEQRRESKIETIATEKTIACDLGPFNLTGRVDRIDRHADGHLEVIDYKSGRTLVSPQDVMESLAMSCYQLILSKLYPDSAVEATIYCLRSGATASYSLAGTELAKFESDILALGQEILEADYTGLLPVRIDACANCDFLSRCEQFWRQQAREESWGEFIDE